MNIIKKIICFFCDHDWDEWNPCCSDPCEEEKSCRRCCYKQTRFNHEFVDSGPHKRICEKCGLEITTKPKNTDQNVSKSIDYDEALKELDDYWRNDPTSGLNDTNYFKDRARLLREKRGS